jgi:SNF2 family DNA or RNA helicase
VWAAILAADQHQYLTAAASADKLMLDLDALGVDGLDGRDYYDGDEELYEEDGTALVLSSRSPAVVWNPAKLKPADWRKQLGEVFPPRDRAAWPSKQEILYVVDVAKNVHGSDLVLSLQSRNRNAKGSFSRPVGQPAGFVGRLRDYQGEGLGWMHFLQRFSFGGCLADDMGVGKTAQILALLESRRELRAAGKPVGPSLVVVPKSLVFNWKEEAARFTPQLRVLDHTGLERNGNDFTAYDLVLTTYGTPRRDAWRFKDAEFDYVVLDEAQVVKNAETESSKAVRLLHGRHRLAVSGTPVENHLGELWTLF